MDTALLESQSAEEVLRWALGTFHPQIALASSFGLEDVVLIDMMVKINPKARVFTLDTGRLNQETYDVMDKIRSRYGIQIEIYFPKAEAVEQMVRERGLNLFYHSIENRKRCCGIRKVEPLNRALAGLSAWVTGLRREQAATRTQVKKVEIDYCHSGIVPPPDASAEGGSAPSGAGPSGKRAGGGIVKLNPLADWTGDQVWGYIRTHGVPYNVLHDQGYPSIGCAPCTRAIKPGEDLRAGRWWWERPEQKECGLHISKH